MNHEPIPIVSDYVTEGSLPDWGCADRRNIVQLMRDAVFRKGSENVSSHRRRIFV